MRITKTKVASVLAITAVVALGGTAAMAYWTETGSGSGTAATGTTVPITVTQTSTISNLYPGGPTQALAGKFTNTNSGEVHLTTVTVGSVVVTKATGASGACTADDYAITGTGTIAGSTVPVGTAVGSWSGLNIAMKNTAVSQDGCKGASLVINYLAS